jgi:hypothetical protein
LGAGGRKYIIFDMGEIARLPYMAHKYTPQQREMIKRAQAAGQYEIAKAINSFASNHPEAAVVMFPLSQVVGNITVESDGGFENVAAQYVPFGRVMTKAG